jgi:hypothetical protein
MINKIVIWIAGLLLVLITAVLISATRQPDTFRVERSASMQASSEKIYSFMSDFHKGDLWSPYEKKDSAMKRTFRGAQSGKGAVYEFDGNKDVGKGRLEIIEAIPPSKVVLTLDMIKPVEGRNIVEYTLEPRGESTLVTWSMNGRNSYLGKIICVFFNMDKMIGKDFEAGLGNLKALVEQH